jgi:hypothetical protein
MAGDWIKMRGNLWDDPRVSKLCDLCDCGEAQVIGALYWLWAAADQHTEDGLMPGLTLRQIDRKTGVQGFGAALCQIGWLEDGADGVRIVNFEEHNGTSAKRRCTDAQRKANVRSVSASEADKDRTDEGQKTPNLGAREREEKEKRREEKDTFSDNVVGASAPRKRSAAPPAVERPDDVDQQTWADWLSLRKAKKAPVTETVVNGARDESGKAGMTLDAFLQVWCLRGSQGLQADWLKPHELQTASRVQPMSFAQQDAAEKRQRWEQMTGRKWPDGDVYPECIDAEPITKRIAA